MSERIHKLLARCGLGSRREIERWILEGRVKVDGRPAEPGQPLRGDERIQIDGRRIDLRERQLAPPRQVLVYHKPAGELCTRHDPEGRPTVFTALPRPKAGGRWITVGRLDLNTSGLMLFTTDGELAHRLMHPSRAIEREYAVRVFGEVAPEILGQMRSGVELDGRPARFERIEDAGGSGRNHWYHVILTEGRYREVRRLWESQGVVVSRLIRVRYGPVTLSPRLAPGRWQWLPLGEVNRLADLVGLAPERPRPVAEKTRRRPATPSRRPRPARAAPPRRRR